MHNFYEFERVDSVNTLRIFLLLYYNNVVPVCSNEKNDFHFCNIWYNRVKERSKAMKYIEHLFVGGSVQDLDTILYSIDKSIPVFHLYCICLFYSNQKNHVEIMSSNEICKKRYKQKDFIVIGVAYGKAEALDLFCYIIQQATEKGNDIQKAEEWIL